MREVAVTELRKAVENLHGCEAVSLGTEPVEEEFEGKPAWQGIVHIFELRGHPTATRAYAWSSPIEGRDKRRFFAVLHQPPVTSPAEAVGAAIVAEQRSGHGQG
jgi:hypothetical protein